MYLRQVPSRGALDTCFAAVLPRLPSGDMPAAGCARVNSYSRGLLGQVSPMSSEVEREKADASDGENPTDSEPMASGKETGGSFDQLETGGIHFGDQLETPAPQWSG